MNKREKVSKLLELTIKDDDFRNIINILKDSFKDVPSEIWNEYLELIDVKDLHIRLQDTYESYFREDEIDFVLNFLESPLSRKYTLLSDLDNPITNGIQKITQEYCEELVSIITLKIDEGGYDTFI